MDEFEHTGILSQETKDILVVALANETAALELIKVIEDAFVEEDPLFEDDGLKKDGSVVMTGNLDLGSNKLINLADPVNPQDAATRAWIEAQNFLTSFTEIDPLALKKDGSDAMSGNLDLAENNIINVDTILFENELAAGGMSLSLTALNTLAFKGTGGGADINTYVLESVAANSSQVMALRLSPENGGGELAYLQQQYITTPTKRYEISSFATAGSLTGDIPIDYRDALRLELRHDAGNSFTPDAGSIQLMSKSDDKAYIKVSAGTELALATESFVTSQGYLTVETDPVWAAQGFRRNGAVAMTGDLNLGNNNIINVSSIEIDDGTNNAPFRIFEGRNQVPVLQSTESGTGFIMGMYSGDHDGTDSVRLRLYGEASVGPSAAGDDNFISIDFQPGLFRLFTGTAGSGQPLPLLIGSSNHTSNDITNAPDITIAASNKTAGTGNGGNLILEPGTSLGGSKGVVNASSSLITSVLDPVGAQDAATKNYVDTTVVTDHTNLTSIGTNTHAQIDTHISDATIHFTQASIDHGSIAGLADDDHTQYVLASGARDITGSINIDGLDILGPTTGPAATTVLGTNPASMTGANNVLIGINAGINLTTSTQSTYIGTSAGKFHTDSNFAVAIGMFAMGAGNGASRSVAVGHSALIDAAVGSDGNTAVGHNVGSNLTTGDFNSLYGLGVGTGLTTGSQNVLLGANAGLNLTTHSNNTFVGYDAGRYWTGLNNIFIGRGSGGTVSSGGNSNIVIGASSTALSIPPGGSGQIAFGSNQNPTTRMWLGAGYVTPTANNFEIRGSSGVGTDIAAGNFTIAAGAGTGTGDGGHLLFKTALPTTTGSSVNALFTALEIDDQQNVVVGDGALATTATDGFFYIPSGNGPPTGVPSTKTGRVAMYYDSLNNSFYMYNGAWRSVALT